MKDRKLIEAINRWFDDHTSLSIQNYKMIQDVLRIGADRDN